MYAFFDLKVPKCRMKFHFRKILSPYNLMLIKLNVFPFKKNTCTSVNILKTKFSFSSIDILKGYRTIYLNQLKQFVLATS